MRCSRITAGGISLLTGALVVSACSSAGSGAPSKAGASGNGPTVVASTTQTADFARQVLGDKGRVIGMLKPNDSPHHHTTTPKDIEALRTADIVVDSGAGATNAWLQPAVRSSGFHGKMVDASAGAKLRTRVKNGHTELDPHLWHNPENARVMTKNITKALKERDPKNKDVYERNTRTYFGKLDALEKQVRTELAAIPEQKRKLVTTHGAFGYYCDHYGIQFVGSVIPSFDDQAELSSKQIDEFVNKLKQTGVSAIFTEATIPAKVAKSVAEEAHVRIVSDPLYSDNNGPGMDYIATEKHNSEVITKNLNF